MNYGGVPRSSFMLREVAVQKGDFNIAVSSTMGNFVWTPLGMAVLIAFLQTHALGETMQNPGWEAETGGGSSCISSDLCSANAGLVPYFQLIDVNELEVGPGESAILFVEVNVCGLAEGSRYHSQLRFQRSESEASWVNFTHTGVSPAALRFNFPCASLPEDVVSVVSFFSLELRGEHPPLNNLLGKGDPFIASVTYPFILSKLSEGCLSSMKSTPGHERSDRSHGGSRGDSKDQSTDPWTGFAWTSEWAVQSDLWKEWYPPAFERSYMYLLGLNAVELDSTSAEIHPEEQAFGHVALEFSLDFPTFVMNLQHRQDRQQHMQALLPTLGFTDVRFPETTHKVGS